MTEQEWLQAANPDAMLEFLRGKASERKLRLFAVACCRRIWHLLVGEEYHRDWHRDELDYWRGCQDAVVLAERFADGEAIKRTLAAVTAYLRPAFHDPRLTAELPLNAAGVTTEAVRFAAELPLNAAGVATEAAVAAALEAGAHAVPSQRVLAAEKKSQCDLLRDIFGPLPFRPITISPTVLAWKDELVVRLAQAAYDERHLPEGTLDNGRLAALADALEEAGCTDADVLGHLRGPGPHVRGCWTVDLCLGETTGTSMAIWLEWVEEGKVFPLVRGQSVVIGRGHHADIDTDMLSVSRRHCEVHWDGCRVWVHDLNTSSGTYINGEHFGDSVHVVEPAGSLLRLGDILRLGPVRFLLATSCRIEPPWLTWHDGLLVSMAQRMYDSRDFSDMPVLADALEEAGCQDQDILGHCRSGGEHVRGCWVVDSLLGKS